MKYVCGIAAGILIGTGAFAAGADEATVTPPQGSAPLLELVADGVPPGPVVGRELVPSVEREREGSRSVVGERPCEGGRAVVDGELRVLEGRAGQRWIGVGSDKFTDVLDAVGLPDDKNNFRCLAGSQKDIRHQCRARVECRSETSSEAGPPQRRRPRGPPIHRRRSGPPSHRQ